jgi:hypothetical protein
MMIGMKSFGVRRLSASREGMTRRTERLLETDDLGITNVCPVQEREEIQDTKLSGQLGSR